MLGLNRWCYLVKELEPSFEYFDCFPIVIEVNQKKIYSGAGEAAVLPGDQEPGRLQHAGAITRALP